MFKNTSNKFSELSPQRSLLMEETWVPRKKTNDAA